MAIDLGVAASVTFTGPTPYEEMPLYYWACDFFLLASKVYQHPITKMKDAETMGRVLCEANAAGIPVIASKSGGIPSVIADGKNGLLFPEDDEISFLEKLDLLLHDKSLANGLVKNGLLMARNHFDWIHILKAHEKAFQGGS